MTAAAESIARKSLDAESDAAPLPAVICVMVWCALSAGLWWLLLAGVAIFA